MVWLLAFSVQDQVEKYGAYIGVASFLGLALLSILYFAQAREVRRLRDWAGRAPERDAELEARVTSQAEEALRAPARAPEPVRRPAVAAVGNLSQETQIAPPPTPIATPASNGHAVPMGPRPATAAAAVAAAVAAAGAGSADEPESEEQAVAPVAATATVPAEPAAAPAESDGDTGDDAAGGTNGNGTGTGEAVAIPRATPRPVAPARRPAQPLRASERSTAVPPRRPTPPRVGARPSRPSAAAPAGESRGRGRGILLGVLAGLVVLAVAAVAITTLGGGGDEKPAPNTTEPIASSTPGDSSAAAGGPAKADTVVVILNGTTTDGLAAQAKTALQEAGYTSDNIPTDTANNQATPTSTVYYAPSRRRQALAVSRALKIDQVAAVTSDIQSLADNSSDPPVKADVVTVLGADRTP
jgi:hypothetical protein